MPEVVGIPEPSGNGPRPAWPGPGADPLQLLRDAVGDLPGRGRVVDQDLLEELGLGRSAKRPAPGEHFVQDHAQAEDIGPAVHPVPFTAGLFRAHVRRRPGERRASAEVLRPQGEAEVGDIRFAVRVKEDVPGLDVPVDDPVVMGVV